MAESVIDRENYDDEIPCTGCGDMKHRYEFLPVPVLVGVGSHRRIEIHTSFLCRGCRWQPPSPKSRLGHAVAARSPTRVFLAAHQRPVRPDEWEALYALFNGRCGICGKVGYPLPGRIANDQDVKESRVRLLADIDPETRKPRGLLCGKCDAALEQLGDSRAMVAVLARYLKIELPITLHSPKEKKHGEDEHDSAASGSDGDADDNGEVAAGGDEAS